MHDRPRSTSDSGAAGGNPAGGRRSARTSGSGGGVGGGGAAAAAAGDGPSSSSAAAAAMHSALRAPLLRLFDSDFVERLREAIPEHGGGGGGGGSGGASGAGVDVGPALFLGGGDDGQLQHGDIEAPLVVVPTVEGAAAAVLPTVFDATCAAAAAAGGDGGANDANANAAAGDAANDDDGDDDDAPVADEDVPKFGELIRQQPGDVIAYLENDALVPVAEFDADDALVLRALAGRAFLVVGRDHFDDDYEPMWLERLARIAGGREAARAAARAAAEEAETQQLHRTTAALYGPSRQQAQQQAQQRPATRGTGGAVSDLEERGSTAGGGGGGSAHGGSLFNGFGGDLKTPLLGGGAGGGGAGGGSSPAPSPGAAGGGGGVPPHQQHQHPHLHPSHPRSGNGGGTGPSPLGGGGPSSVTPPAALRDVAGSLAAAAPRESAALAAAMARRAAAAAAKAAEKQQQQPSSGVGKAQTQQQQQDEQQQKQQAQQQQKQQQQQQRQHSADPQQQQQQQQQDQQHQDQDPPPPPSPSPPQQQQQGRLNPSLGWTSTVHLEAYVVNVRDAAAEGHRGLLRPLLQRHKARGCPLAVFSLPAVQAVIEWKWQTWARRALRAELACYVAWIAAFTLFTLLFQREDAEAPLAELCAGWSGLLTVAASLWSAAASLPFVYMEACTIRAYGFGGWVSLINLVDAATYALQFGITFLHLLRWGLSTSWFNILVAAQTLGLWFKLQYYGRAFDPTRGVSMEAVQRVVHDLRWFFLLFGAILLGFGLSFFALYRNDRESVAAFSSLPRSLAMMVSFTLMMFDYSDFYGSSVPVASILLFCFFSFVVCIMLFNLLIALMTSSFQRISADQGGLRLALGRAEMVDELETTLPAWARAPPPRFLHVLRVHPQAQYTVDLSSVWSGIGSLERTLLGAERETAARVEALERSAAALDRKLDVLLRFQLAGVLGERQAAAAALAAAFGAGGGGSGGRGAILLGPTPTPPPPSLEQAASVPLGPSPRSGSGSGGAFLRQQQHHQQRQHDEEEEDGGGSGGGSAGNGRPPGAGAG